jgi:RNA polymerase sigma-70 factor (ECF subfamily)
MSRFWPSSLFDSFAANDEQIMWRVQKQDDSAAFATLMQRWEEPIRRMCERMLNDPHRAEDLAQDAFTRVFARRRDYEPNARFSTFLWRIALNLCYDELRRRQRRAEFPLDESDTQESSPHLSEDPSPAAQLEQREQADSVRAALQTLPEHYRAVVILRHYEGLKFREIASVLNIPEGTVKSRMAEAIDQLAVLLKEFTPPAAHPEARHKQTLCV